MVDSTDSSNQPRIVRGQVDSLSILEITDYELEILEQGSPNSLYLNFGVFFLSTATSFLTTLLTVSIESMKLFTVFLSLTICGFSAGLVLLVLWYRSKSNVKNLIKKIKARVPLNIAPISPKLATSTSGVTESN